MSEFDVRQCLNNIIEKVITNNKNINKNINNNINKNINVESHLLKARDVIGTLIFIDLDRLKYNFRLEGANVFKTLFGINENSPYGDFPLKTDEKGCITLLEDFKILSSDWYLLINFLNKGIIPHYLLYKNNNKFKDMVLISLEKLNEICNIFGGIPSFDLFYSNFHKELIDNEYNEYNPVTPRDDYRHLYSWGCTKASDAVGKQNFEKRHPWQEGWSAVTVNNNHFRFSPIIWYRRIRYDVSISKTTTTGTQTIDNNENQIISHDCAGLANIPIIDDDIGPSGDE